MLGVAEPMLWGTDCDPFRTLMMAQGRRLATDAVERTDCDSFYRGPMIAQGAL